MNKMGNLSLDDYLSKRMGLDNRLGPLHKSITFWAILFFAAVTMAATIQDERFLSSAGNLVIWALFVLSIAFTVIFYVIGRTRITRLLSWVDELSSNREEFKEILRTISHVLAVLTLVALMCVLFAVTFIR